MCVCDCGVTFTAIGSNIRKGDTKSCGCLAIEWAQTMGSNKDFIALRARSLITHGHKRKSGATPEYKTWLGMKRRCYDKKCKDYPNWGGRGIRVCDEWNESFEAFLRDMGPRPVGPYSIDRLDPNGDYALGNCRWATIQQQGAENHRSNVEVCVDGVVYPSVAAAARLFGVKVSTAWMRIYDGWDVARAVTAPTRSRGAEEDSTRPPVPAPNVDA